MKAIIYVLIAVIAVSAVAVGAYNEINGTNNRPLNFKELISTFSDLSLNLGFDITIEQYRTLTEHIEQFRNYTETDEYKESSSFKQFCIDLWRGTFIPQILVLGSDIIYIMLALVLDACITVVTLLTFAYRLIFGVPA